MKKSLILSLLFLAFYYVSSAQASKQVFSSPNLKAVVYNSKTVAIMPFTVGISFKKMPKGATIETIKADEIKESVQMQQGMYTFLLRKAKDYTVSFQDVERTNALLKKAGVFETFSELLPDSLAKILGVDAVIKSSWNYEKTGSEAGAIASAFLLGVSKSTGSGQLVMQVYNGKDGELVWRLAKEMNEGAFSSGNELMERMMRKVGRNFPFEK